MCVLGRGARGPEPVSGPVRPAMAQDIPEAHGFQEEDLSKQQDHREASVIRPRRGERPRFSNSNFPGAVVSDVDGAAEETAVCGVDFWGTDILKALFLSFFAIASDHRPCPSSPWHPGDLRRGDSRLGNTGVVARDLERPLLQPIVFINYDKIHIM